MCLILVAYDVHPKYRLIIAANRDEFYARPTAPAAYWDDRPELLGGRDLERGGTWLATNRQGKLAAVTNVRASHAVVRSPRSRGLIINEYLLGDLDAERYLSRLTQDANAYEGFNLLLWDNQTLQWWSNQIPKPRRLSPGVYALSNHLLDTPWPKVTRIKAAYAALKSQQGESLEQALLDVLSDDQCARDEDLPQTGVSITAERLYSSIFIRSEQYGTRASTVVTIDRQRRLRFVERRFGDDGRCLGESSFGFELSAKPA